MVSRYMVAVVIDLHPLRGCQVVQGNAVIEHATPSRYGARRDRKAAP